jgi:glutamine amidotransferase
MCRVLGCVASEPVSLRRELLEAQYPLLRQESQGEGWGMAAYPRAEGEEPRCTRFPQASPDAPELTAAASATGRLHNAHVRRATVGAHGPHNTHPFCLGPYSFSHNGTILNFTRLFDPAIAPPHGETDSEHLFRLVMHHLDREDPIDGLRFAIRCTIERFAFSSLSFLFSDGERLYAYRLGLTELHWIARPGQLLVASERLDDDEAWHSVKQDALLVLDPADIESPHAERLVGDDWLARADIRELEGGARLTPTAAE